MPLSLSSRDQSSGHLFYNRRLRAATTRFSVRMMYDDGKQRGAMWLSVVLVLIGIGWMGLLHWLKPTGVATEASIVGDRDSGQIYAKIDGHLIPMVNLLSARLATGQAQPPTWVTPTEIAKYPQEAQAGIPGAPSAMPVRTGAPSAWAVCDTAGASRSTDKPTVTAIAGEPSRAGRATPLSGDNAVLAQFAGSTYVIWGGKRSQVDQADRAVTSSLGIDPAVTYPIPMSRALFDAMPATEPLRVPQVPLAGQDSKWMPGTPVGTVLQVQSASGGTQFYVLVPDGVQKITSLVADLLRAADSYGAAAPKAVSPDLLVKIPQVSTLAVEYYPTGRLKFVDPEANPTTCVGWEKASTDPTARVTVYNGRGLPVSPSQDGRIVKLVRDDRGPDSVEADQVLMLPGASNLVFSTSGVPDARSKESMFWVSDFGVRFGIANDNATIKALDLKPQEAQQAPWPLLRVFAAGPELSQGLALRQFDTLPGGGTVRPMPVPGGVGPPAQAPPPAPPAAAQAADPGAPAPGGN